LGYGQLQYLFNLTNLAGCDFITKIYRFAWEKNLFPSTKIYNGKLSLILDPECKVRVIAMLDGVSQQFLKPIHDALMINLSKLPCDRTYTQDPMNN
jgi:hypothetical protein